MKYRKLGASDLLVSEISLGSWLTYGVGVDRDRAGACVNRAFELGINFIDTANVYGRGAAETFLGEALAKRPRDSYVLATKVFFPMSDSDRGLSRAQILKQMDASLTRLRIDHVDLYQCHRYDAETPLEETMRALSDAVRQGKARYIGFSEWSADQIAAAFALPAMERFVSSQPQYSLLWRQPEEEVIPLCREKHVSQIVWSPLAQGVLTGKYLPGAPLPARFARHQHCYGPVHPTLDRSRHPGGGAKTETCRGEGRLHHFPICTCLGAARVQCCIRHRGCEQARTIGRERSRLGADYRSGPVCRGRNDRRTGSALTASPCRFGPQFDAVRGYPPIALPLRRTDRRALI